MIKVAGHAAGPPGSGLPAPVAAAVRAVRADLSAAPFLAPEADRLRELGLGARAIAAAQRAGLLLRVSDQIVLGPDAAALAARVLARLPQPFTTAQARQALGTTRRVAIPLLEYLDASGATERLPDDRRRLIYPPSKIIPAGSLSFLVAFIYTNPFPGNGWLVPASVQLGARPWRMTLDQANLTTGGMQPIEVVNDVFPSTAPMITPVLFLLPTPNPGPDPWLIEANVTVYVDIPGQPFAAFATNFYDIDNDPGFPFFPPIPAENANWRYDLPNRYLIFS
jgi:hypothetical protein